MAGKLPSTLAWEKARREVEKLHSTAAGWNMSEREAAEKLGVSRSRINQYRMKNKSTDPRPTGK